MTGGPAREVTRRRLLQGGVGAAASMTLAGCQERLDEVGNGSLDRGTERNGTSGGNGTTDDDGGERTVVVEKGDTLWDIADEEYGDPTKWEVIAEANDIENPRDLEPGTTLVIPELESGDEDTSGDDGERTVVVEEGDTLWDIAEEEYGDPTKWRVIAEANDIEDPRSLEPGTVLVIPELDSGDGSDGGDDTSGNDGERRTRTVEEGDTLWEIAEEEYGNPDKWLVIAVANDIEDPRSLEPGTTLLIPALEPRDDGENTRVVEEGQTLWDIAEAAYGDRELWLLIAMANDVDDPANPEPGRTLVVPIVDSDDGGEDDTSGDDGGDDTACDDGEERTVVVEKGDTLWDIAEEEYGDPTEWERIAEANDIEDPRSIEPGTTLVIPAENSCE